VPSPLFPIHVPCPATRLIGSRFKYKGLIAVNYSHGELVT